MTNPLKLFEGYGIELEYMIVDRGTLKARPIADAVLGDSGEVEREKTAWSNELIQHLVELKTNGPAPSLTPLAGYFQSDIAEINATLAPLGAQLLGTAMHPRFDPRTETVIWPHEYTEVYHTYDRIFGTKGHGWANVQSMHINLPFGDADEFGRLHAAIRVVLPFLPALAASSPFVEGRPTGSLDNRLQYYRTNSYRIPSATAKVIPEPVYSPEEYRTQILERIWADTAPHDPEGLLRFEFANARGAIARFDRGAIEIRVIDLQECPKADLAIAALTVAAVRAIVEERFQPLSRARAVAVAPLHTLFLACVMEGEEAVLSDLEVLSLFGVSKRVTAGELWRHLLDVLPIDVSFVPTLDAMLRAGTLAGRILRAVGPDASIDRIDHTYRALARCLEAGTLFLEQGSP